MLGGASTSPNNRWYTGTVGVCVTLNDHETYILSCNHVLADANQLRIGVNIVQPSLPDGGDPKTDVVAVLDDFVPLDFGTTTITILGIPFTFPNVNLVDVAIAMVTNGFNGANRDIHWVGFPKYNRQKKWDFWKLWSLLNKQVCKMGRTTHYTIGTIESFWYDTWVGPYSNGQNAWFEDQLYIVGENGPFSQPGDSESLVVDIETNEPLGLLFAGTRTYSVVNRIDEVMLQQTIPQL